MVRKAFTLIELLIVVIVVAILAAAAVPAYNALVSRGYETEVISGLSRIRSACRMYETQNGSWPAELKGENTDNSLVAADLIEKEEFAQNKYTSFSDYSISTSSQTENGSGELFAVWNGDIGGYDKGTVEMNMQGEVFKKEKSSGS